MGYGENATEAFLWWDCGWSGNANDIPFPEEETLNENLKDQQDLEEYVEDSISFFLLL